MRLFIIGLSAALSLAAQNEQDIASGKALFRSNCAFCHGLTAAGGRGPSLISERLIRNTSDGEIQAIIKNGIAGTTMPAFNDLQKDDLEHLTSYIRNLAGTNVKPAALLGDPAHGKQIYAANGCANCHRIGDTGSIYGPELTRIGGARSAEYLKQSILEPSADIPTDYEGVTATLRDGKKVRGVRVNEDTFSIQIRKPDQSFAMFQKSELQDVTPEKKSLMPAYAKLPAKDLNDLVGYLETLRAGATGSKEADKAKGIH